MSQMQDVDAKLILFTAAISVAMLFAGEDSISWVVPVKGKLAWFLLLIMHMFFGVLHWSKRGSLFNFKDLSASRNSRKWRSGNKSASAKTDIYLNTVLLGFAFYTGFIIMVLQIIWLTWYK